MKRNISILFILTATITIIFSGCNSNSKKDQKPKYIFFMIGDGFGLQHSMLAEDYLDAMTKDTATCHLDLLKMPVIGNATTYSTSSFVTCSSASGTALSTGHKTKNNLLGVAPDSITPVTSIAKMFHDEGYNVGLISSVSIDHATPASFYAHVKDRNMYLEISNQLKDCGYEFLGGGGLRGFLKDSAIYDTMRVHGYTVTNNLDVMKNHKLSDGKLYTYSSLTRESGDIPYVIDSRNHDMHLPVYVKKAIELFENDTKGFFMMIEGGQIDYGSHDNDPGATLLETLMFNEAYKLAYDFYLRHPDETLIIMTSDHETGGLSIGQQTSGYACYPDVLQYQKISGEKLQNVINKYKETNKKPSIEEIYTLLSQNFGFNNGANHRLELNKYDSLKIEYMYMKTFEPGRISKYGDDLKSKIFKSDLRGVNNFGNLAIRMISEKAGIGWTTGSHTGCSVPVRAIGVNQDKFAGFYDNTDIPKKIYPTL